MKAIILFAKALVVLGVVMLALPVAYALRREVAPITSAFIEETHAVLRNWQLADAGYWLPADFTGRWINVSGGFRRTVGQPANAERTIYLFGSSTIYNNEVPDEQTIASQLQLLTKDRVVNVGMVPGPAPLLTARLRDIPLRQGDIVVFYVGASETADVHLRVTRGDNLDALIRQARASSIRAVREADTYTRSRGATLVVLLGAHLWSKPLSPHEESLAADKAIAGDGFKESLLATWAMWRTIIPASHDLTHVLDQAGDVYYNTTHVNERGNAIIARAIFDFLTIY